MDTQTIEKKIRIGMISFAHTAHAVSYSSALSHIDGAELAAIYDDNDERGRLFANQFQAPFYKSLDEMLKREDIQGVIVCSPTNRHRDLVSAAAQAGKHVLCEKPIATNMSDAQAMIAACKSAGVILQIPFVCRFYPMVKKAKKIVESGEIGRVVGVVGGNRGRPPLSPVYPEWITDPVQAGGGALLDHSVHVTDSMRFIINMEVESVFGVSSVFGEQGFKVEDCGLLFLTFQSGAIGTVDPSWSIPENNPYHYDFYLRILGEKGTISLDDTRQALVVASDRPAQRGVTAEPIGVDVDVEMVKHYIHCIRLGENQFPAASGEDGLRALEIALAAYASIRDRQPVNLPLKERQL